jgi:hypothetical protein
MEFCPWEGCEGILVMRSSFHSDMQYSQYDKNVITEQWECPVCCRSFIRSYSWEITESVRSSLAEDSEKLAEYISKKFPDRINGKSAALLAIELLQETLACRDLNKY